MHANFSRVQPPDGSKSFTARTATIAGCLIALCFISACSSLSPANQYAVDLYTIDPIFKSSLTAGSVDVTRKNDEGIDLDNTKDPLALTFPGILPSSGKIIATKLAVSERRDYYCVAANGCSRLTIRQFGSLSEFDRNMVLERLLTTSDKICERHKAGIIAAVSANGFGRNISVLGAGAVAAVFGGNLARIMNAAITGIEGSSGAISRNIYQSMTIDTVLATIDEVRAQHKIDIKVKINGGSKKINGETVEFSKMKFEEYTIEAGIADVRRYHDSCSFYAGLVAMVKKAKDAAKLKMKEAAKK